jgi:Small-conductance mechanosensitive channel
MMKQKKFTLVVLFIITLAAVAQTVTTNRNVVGLEHNMLFNATTRFKVTQTGNAQVYLPMMFDGIFMPSYSDAATISTNPTIITIEGLPNYNTQAGAWVGWSTRYWPARRFKIEEYNTWNGNTLGWITVADYSNIDYDKSDFTVQLPSSSPTALRFTFYESWGDNGRLGLSELFYLQPEGTSPYNGLLKHEDGIINTVNGNIGISTTAPDQKLTVKGKIHAEEVIVDLNVPAADYVFAKDYSLMPLHKVEQYVKTNSHLPDVPSATEIKDKGLSMGEMQNKLLQKIEELTLYAIEQNKKIQQLEKQNQQIAQQNQRIEQLENQLREIKK